MKLSQSPRLNEALQARGINTYHDVLKVLPRTYLDLHLSDLTTLSDKMKLVIEGKLVSTPTIAKHGKLSWVRFHMVSNDHRFFSVIAYNRPYLLSQLTLGENYTITGSYDQARQEIQLIKVFKGSIPEEERIRPVYSLPETIENHVFVRLMQKALKMVDHFDEWVPLTLKERYHLLDKREALSKIHFPQSFDDIKQGYRTLKYEECFLFTLRSQWIRHLQQQNTQKRPSEISLTGVNDFVRALPFRLTKDQLTAVREIVLDMNQDTLMYRLMQGDVGTGKTLVAAIALYANYLRGDQGAFMAPTDSLARQHYRTFSEWFKDTPIKVALLVGEMSLKEKADTKEALQDGRIHLVIGTHALFSEDVIYARLGLAVIDEQHRFGVQQRASLAAKGDRVDLLFLSATPIPRTLALSVYGDLDVTTIQTFPSLKREVTTKVVAETAAILDIKIHEALQDQRNIYIIAPLIGEESGEQRSVKELYEEYERRFPGQVGILHGLMSGAEKEAALTAFTKREKPILISTTVVEVGIDVKEASVMLVYDAHRFGLASLHQLRGRIGRDGHPAFCFLLHREEAEKEDYEKLSILERSEDGFVIAEEDLRLRGPGEMTGLRQSGLPNFHYVNLIHDLKMFEVARLDAAAYLANLDSKEGKRLLEYLKTHQDEVENDILY